MSAGSGPGPLSPAAARDALLARLQREAPVAGHEIIARSLALNGISHVYAVPGRPIDGTLAACMRQGLRVIGTRHQQAAALMSAAHNYVAGALRSAVIVSAGPAVTNAATGVLVAHDNRWPLLVIGGRHGLTVGGERSFQYLDGERFMTPFVKYAALVSEADEIADCLSKACGIAMCGAPGPTFVDFGAEALAATTRWRRREIEGASQRELSRAAPDRVREAARLFAHARRPVLLVGKGVRWSRGWDALRRLVDEHEVPFAAAPMARGFLSDDHPLCMTAVRGQALADADLVVMVGGRFNWTFHYGLEISSSARIVRIDVDPKEADQVLGRGVGLIGDAGATVSDLLDAVAELGRKGRSGWRDVDWIARLRRMRADSEAASLRRAEGDERPMSPYRWVLEARECLPSHAITVLDGNVVMSAAQSLLPARAPVTRLTPGTNGCMGVGIPFAIGAKLARPDLPVVAFCGDFSFGLSAMELETAVRYKIPVSIIVANNGGHGGATRQREFFPPPLDGSVVCFNADARHDLLMEALGGRGVRVTEPRELEAALQMALASDLPTCIDVVTNEGTALAPVI